MRLNAGPLALLNLTLLVPDDELDNSNMLIGLPVLKHLRIDTKMMLEQNVVQHPWRAETSLRPIGGRAKR